MITNADKGGTVVILDVEDYIKEVTRQLHNTENYKKIITIQLQPTKTCQQDKKDSQAKADK